jgi:hypothetical protein
MKPATPVPWRLRSGLPFAYTVLLSIVVCSASGPADASPVDSELVLLVDITQSGLNSRQFDTLMDSYASTFTSLQVLDSIQSGYYGRIAVSMMFFGNSNTQVVGIPWMMIGNSEDAALFADLARSVERPFSATRPNVAAAIQAASLSFGTETGGADNGFESMVQVIEIASARRPQNRSAGAAAAASQAALISGVDLINALALGNQAAMIADFYAENVIGSTLDEVAASASTSPVNGALSDVINQMIGGTVETGAQVSLNAVPEPSPLIGLLSASLLLLIRRRR